jgi:hypothetical protein
MFTPAFAKESTMNRQIEVAFSEKSKRDHRNKVVAVRLTEAEMLRVNKAVAADGRSQSDWLRDRVLVTGGAPVTVLPYSKTLRRYGLL